MDVQAAIAQHTLAKGELIGTFSNNGKVGAQ